jgi:hypothetical protein
MKIVVTKQESGKHKVEVVEGSTTFHTELVASIKQRDEVVWSLAATYNAVDIEFGAKIVKKTTEFRYSEIPSIPALYESEAREYFDEEEEFVFERILEAIGEGIEVKADTIRLFEIDGTGKYLTSNREDWIGGLKQAIDYFLTVERYEMCVDAQKMIDKLG